MMKLVKIVVALSATFALACGGTAKTTSSDDGATPKKSLTKFQGDRLEKAKASEEE